MSEVTLVPRGPLGNPMRTAVSIYAIASFVLAFLTLLGIARTRLEWPVLYSAPVEMLLSPFTTIRLTWSYVGIGLAWALAPRLGIASMLFKLASWVLADHWLETPFVAPIADGCDDASTIIPILVIAAVIPGGWRSRPALIAAICIVGYSISNFTAADLTGANDLDHLPESIRGMSIPLDRGSQSWLLFIGAQAAASVAFMAAGFVALASHQAMGEEP